MFSGCTSLNYIKCLAVNKTSSSTTGWLYNVAATGTFVKNSAATWDSGINGIPTGWNVQTASS